MVKCIRIFLVLFFSLAAYAGQQSIQDYADQCNKLIGTPVLPFNCDEGEEVPVEHYTNPDPNKYGSGTCDRPNQLNLLCDPGSKFQVLFNNDDAYAVAHCRKKGGNGNGIFKKDSNGNLTRDPVDSLYGDIAVIQHNKKNGVTCFYQSHVRENGVNMLDGSKVQAPNSHSTLSFWEPPSTSCVTCHDSAAIIRSPYLAQLSGQAGKPPLPWLNPDGTQNTRFNDKDSPYNFTGDVFKNIVVKSVHIDNNQCVNCHNMGVEHSSTDFGLRSVGLVSMGAKTPVSDASPLWMPYPPPTRQSDHCDLNVNDAQCKQQKDAQAISDCARGLSTDITCKISDRGRYIPPPTESSVGRSRYLAPIINYILN